MKTTALDGSSLNPQLMGSGTAVAVFPSSHCFGVPWLWKAQLQAAESRSSGRARTELFLTCSGQGLPRRYKEELRNFAVH